MADPTTEEEIARTIQSLSNTVQTTLEDVKERRKSQQISQKDKELLDNIHNSLKQIKSNIKNYFNSGRQSNLNQFE